MKAYVIATVSTIGDEALFDSYRKEVPATVSAFGRLPQHPHQIGRHLAHVPMQPDGLEPLWREDQLAQPPASGRHPSGNTLPSAVSPAPLRECGTCHLAGCDTWDADRLQRL
jgi:hypothetical protein